MTVAELRLLLDTVPDDLRVVIYALDQQGLAAPVVQRVVVRQHGTWWADATWDATHGARRPGDAEALLFRYQEEEC